MRELNVFGLMLQLQEVLRCIGEIPMIIGC
jgi:hypothetical protein